MRAYEQPARTADATFACEKEEQQKQQQQQPYQGQEQAVAARQTCTKQDQQHPDHQSIAGDVVPTLHDSGTVVLVRFMLQALYKLGQQWHHLTTDLPEQLCQAICMALLQPLQQNGSLGTQRYPCPYNRPQSRSGSSDVHYPVTASLCLLVCDPSMQWWYRLCSVTRISQMLSASMKSTGLMHQLSTWLHSHGARQIPAVNAAESTAPSAASSLADAAGTMFHQALVQSMTVHLCSGLMCAPVLCKLMNECQGPAQLAHGSGNDRQDSSQASTITSTDLAGRCFLQQLQCTTDGTDSCTDMQHQAVQASARGLCMLYEQCAQLFTSEHVSMLLQPLDVLCKQKHALLRATADQRSTASSSGNGGYPLVRKSVSFQANHSQDGAWRTALCKCSAALQVLTSLTQHADGRRLLIASHEASSNLVAPQHISTRLPSSLVGVVLSAVKGVVGEPGWFEEQPHLWGVIWQYVGLILQVHSHADALDSLHHLAAFVPVLRKLASRAKAANPQTLVQTSPVAVPEHRWQSTPSEATDRTQNGTVGVSPFSSNNKTAVHHGSLCPGGAGAQDQHKPSSASLPWYAYAADAMLTLSGSCLGTSLLVQCGWAGLCARWLCAKFKGADADVKSDQMRIAEGLAVSTACLDLLIEEGELLARVQRCSAWGMFTPCTHHCMSMSTNCAQPLTITWIVCLFVIASCKWQLDDCRIGKLNRAHVIHTCKLRNQNHVTMIVSKLLAMCYIT